MIKYNIKGFPNVFVAKTLTSTSPHSPFLASCENTEDPFQVVVHPVSADARVKYPSHFKRFEVQMFSFMDEDNSSYLVSNLQNLIWSYNGIIVACDRPWYMVISQPRGDIQPIICNI